MSFSTYAQMLDPLYKVPAMKSLDFLQKKEFEGRTYATS